MGPDLFELYEDGKADDEVAAIIRLGHFEALPGRVRVISQFGDIITVRLTRRDVPLVSGASEVEGMIAGDSLLGPDLEIESLGPAELSADTVVASDERRPNGESATGRGVVVGVVDWGFDFAHPDFLNADGTTRILALWDQRGGKQAGSPQPFGYGVFHDRDAINRALKQPDPYAALHYHPADADTGIGCHGTHVASIAAGSGSTERPAGIAPEADLVLVHNTPWDDSQSGRLGDSVTVLEGIDFIARIAGTRPWVINLSMGCHADQHDGSTLVELGLDAVVRAEAGRAICMSAGNYFNKRIHASGRLKPTDERSFAWTINRPKPTDYNQLQIWYSWQDKLELVLRSPDGTVSARTRLGERAKLMNGNTELGNVYHRGQEPNSLDNHITVFLYKEAPPGEWTATLVGSDVIDGRYHAWIEREVGCPPCQSRFVGEDADPQSTTGTICNGRRTLAVGAYDNHDSEHKLGPFSSVGPTRDGRLKPDLCAPGVAVLAARSAPRSPTGHVPAMTRMSGTSMAAPHVTGTVALMFQAAPRRLRIEETHNLLLAGAQRVTEKEFAERIGVGFLDIQKAVQSARTVGVTGSTFSQRTVQVPSPALPAAPAAPVRTPTAARAAASESFVAEGGTAPGPCPDVPAPHRELSRGSQDPAVREAQRKLNVFHLMEIAAGRNGLPDAPLVPDCVFGTHTFNAVKGFQQLVFPGQPREIDGVIGSRTWAQLDLVPDSPPAVIPVPPPPQPLPPQPAPCGTLWVWINAFIPKNVPGAAPGAPSYTFSVPAGPHAGKTAIPCPTVALPVNWNCSSVGYLTDQRTFDATLSAGQRMRSIAEISLVPPAFVSHPGAEHVTSGTVEIDKTSGAVTCAKSAAMNRCVFKNFRVDPDPSAPLSGNFFIRLDVVGAAADPCVNLAADIDYDGTIAIFCSPRGNHVEVSFSGNLDSFPAFEMYASLGGVTKALFRVPPPPGNTVTDLLGSASNPIGGRVVFDGCRLLPAESDSDAADSLVGARETTPALVELADAAVAEGIRLHGPAPRVATPLTETVFGEALMGAGTTRRAAAWEIFDSLIYPGRDALCNRVQEAFEVLARGGDRVHEGLQPGDVLLRRSEGRQAHVAVLGTSELVPLGATSARGWTVEGGGAGSYAQVIEGGYVPRASADAYARQITDDDGRVLPNQVLLRPRATDVAERFDPLSMVVGLGLASTMNQSAQAARPAAPAPTPTSPAGSDAPDTSEKEPAAVTCAKDLAAFGSAWRGRDLKQGRNPRPQIIAGKPLCEGQIDLLQTGPDGSTIDLLLWNFDIDGAYPKRAHEAALDRLIFEVHARLAGAAPKSRGYSIFLTGFASRTGDTAYNVALADERELAVQTYITTFLERNRRIPEAPIAPLVAFDHNPGGFDPAAVINVETAHARSVRVIATPSGSAPPPPRPFPTAQIEVVLDQDNDTVVDGTAPVATFIRFGLWNKGYDAAGDILNDRSERKNFVGLDARRFYFRVRDANTTQNSVTVQWKTLRADASDDDAPGNLDITLLRVAAGVPVFVSKAVMLVTDDTDVLQPTDSGLAPPLADAGVRQRGQSNHRLRRAVMDGFLHAVYSPAGQTAVSLSLPLFDRHAGDERKRVKMRVINYGSLVTDAYIAGQIAHANSRWNQIGYRIDAAATIARPVPPAALDGSGLYAGSANNVQEQAALEDLLKITPDNTLTAVFVPQTGQNAYTTIAERTTVTLADRYFIFINAGLDLNNDTLAHELSHVLFNRFDGDTQRRFFTLNTNPSNSFGLPLPDVRIRRRIQDLHTPDPNQDPSNENVINWARRTRTGRFPIAAGVIDAATATTGNTLSEAF